MYLLDLVEEYVPKLGVKRRREEDPVDAVGVGHLLAVAGAEKEQRGVGEEESCLFSVEHVYMYVGLGFVCRTCSVSLPLYLLVSWETRHRSHPLYLYMCLVHDQ